MRLVRQSWISRDIILGKDIPATPIGQRHSSHTAEACWNRCAFLMLTEHALEGFSHDGACLAIMKKAQEAGALHGVICH